MPLFGRDRGRKKSTDENNIVIEPASTPRVNGFDDDSHIPNDLPILPLRGVVVYPMMWLPLTVGQERSIRLIESAADDSRVIGLVTSRDPENEEPAPADLYEIGTAAVVHRLLRAPDGTIRLIVQGLERIRVTRFIQEEPFLRAQVMAAVDEEEDSVEVEALSRNAQDLFRRLIQLVPHLPDELEMAAMNVEDARQLVYLIASSLRLELADAQEILEINHVRDKLIKLNSLLSKELEVLELGRKIQSEAQNEMEKMQREFYLREQLKAIQKELGEEDEQAAEIKELEERISKAGMPEEPQKEAKRELERLRKMPPQAAEYGVIKTYLDWIVSLPWQQVTEDNLDITHARQVLDEDHYDLKEIKERILEFLAVRKLRVERKGQFTVEDEHPDLIRKQREGVILCFVGPPGVGKTSLGLSIARALGRKFVRLALGGIHDEAEVRGFRRTYIGSMPGRILQMLRRVESRNPVFMLDEVDKLGHDFRGDPSAALLEVLDPEQNSEFRDHYLDVPFDLSQVIFITTANWLETIPEPLLDRMEILQLSGYTELEKVKIAQGYLIPRQLRENSLHASEIVFEEAALHRMISDHTREAGVRALERQIGKICRKIATRAAERGADDKGAIAAVTITVDNLAEHLGKAKFYNEVAERTDRPGVATGLAVTAVGGDILFIEATRMIGNKGFTVTGQLGEVMKESAQAALSFVRSMSAELGLDDDFFNKSDIHLHIPAGAVPKDGPSAGVTMATALASLLTGRLVRSNVAMTGEITLRGQVLPIGGLKEKALAASRAGLDTVIMPKRNEPDLDDLPDEVRQKIRFVMVESVTEVFETALEPVRLASSVSAAGQSANGATAA